MSKSLGELIRERRLGLGLSLGQLATKLSTSSAEVRRWERGEEIPAEEARSVLAEVLEVDAGVVAELAAAVEPPKHVEPEEPESPTELVSAAAGVSLPSVSQPERPAADIAPLVEMTPIDPVEAIDLLVADPEEPIAEPTVDPMPPPALVTAEQAALPEEDQAVPRPVPLRYPESVPVGVSVEITEPAPNPWNPLRYLYDPEKPWLYWVRAGLTLVVLLILLNILFDSIGELFDKLGEVIDSIEPTDAVESGEQSLE